MSTERIQNYSGQIIAVIDTDTSGLKTLKTYSGTILGTYDPNRNVTQNYRGTILSYGNTLASLIPSKSNKLPDQDTSYSTPSYHQNTTTVRHVVDIDAPPFIKLVTAIIAPLGVALHALWVVLVFFYKIMESERVPWIFKFILSIVGIAIMVVGIIYTSAWILLLVKAVHTS